jgi:heme-degrading monooxygenase HmoA
MAEQQHVVRFVRAYPNPGRDAELQQWIEARYRERAGFPGLVSFFFMSTWADARTEFAIATVWDSHAALERYVDATSDALVEPGAAQLVDSMTVTEYELLVHADYDFVNPQS